MKKRQLLERIEALGKRIEELEHQVETLNQCQHTASPAYYQIEPMPFTFTGDVPQGWLDKEVQKMVLQGRVRA